jgi:D-glycero-alpha-D-manno-heptose-7-phosphate kinase
MEKKKRDIVVSQTPYRLCLGGGTDLIPYVRRYGGHAFSATIDKYVTIVVRRRHGNKILFHYALGTEEAENGEEINHPYVQAVLARTGIRGGADIASFTDVPFASGLGSSGAFTVGLLNALWALNGVRKSPRELAEEAAHIEIEVLKSPIGKHDQYLAAYGGVCDVRFLPDGAVRVKKISFSLREKQKFEERILLMYSGMTHSASRQLSPLFERLLAGESEAVQAMHSFRETGLRLARFVAAGDFTNFGTTLNDLHEIHRNKFSSSNERLDRMIEIGKKNGALGAFISGSGGGGFFFFVCPNVSVKKKIAEKLEETGAKMYPFAITSSGSRILFSM